MQISLEKVIEKSNEEKENKEYNLKGFKNLAAECVRNLKRVL